MRAVTPLSPQPTDDDGKPVPEPEPRLEALLRFWFDLDANDEQAIERAMRRWFFSTEADDKLLASRFGELAEAAADGELDAFAATPRGRLALIILLDQLPRSLYRGTPRAFATDGKALDLALEGLAAGFPETLTPLERMFFLMPLQHAESRAVQRLSVDTFEALAASDLPEALAATFARTAEFARLHRDIIERFGRFPHRNRTLGRSSTAAEREFLDSGGPSFGQ